MNLDLRLYPSENVGYISDGGFKMGIDNDVSFDRPDYGFIFKSYKGGHVSKSEQLTSSDLKEIDDKYKNIQNLVVQCHSCKALMEHSPSLGISDIDDGFYRCPICGKLLKESTLYNQLDKENERWMRDYSDIDDSYLGYDEDDDSWLEDL